MRISGHALPEGRRGAACGNALYCHGKQRDETISPLTL